MSWSYSRLLDFEQCRYRYKLKYKDKVPEQKSDAADRGTAIHQMAEDFVSQKLKSLPVELMKFADDFSALRARYKEGHVSLEGEWGFDKHWQPHEYKYAWLRMKADAVAFNPQRTQAIVIDYKTGAKWGNEIKHAEQTQLYALAAAIREPRVTTIITELWYLDKDDMSSNTYTREQAMRFIPGFDKRARKIDDAKEFGPNPNMFTCKWCPYGPNKGGQCPHGVTESNMSISDYRKKFL